MLCQLKTHVRSQLSHLKPQCSRNEHTNTNCRVQTPANTPPVSVAKRPAPPSEYHEKRKGPPHSRGSQAESSREGCCIGHTAWRSIPDFRILHKGIFPNKTACQLLWFLSFIDHYLLCSSIVPPCKHSMPRVACRCSVLIVLHSRLPLSATSRRMCVWHQLEGSSTRSPARCGRRW